MHNIRIIDIRASQSSPLEFGGHKNSVTTVLKCPTKYALILFSDNLFFSAGKSQIFIWDKRNNQSPLISLSNDSMYTNWFSNDLMCFINQKELNIYSIKLENDQIDRDTSGYITYRTNLGTNYNTLHDLYPRSSKFFILFRLSFNSLYE